MKKVYTAKNPQEAQVIKDFLEENGIPAFIHGQHIQAIFGEIPLLDTYPWVCVREEDYEEAEGVIAEFLEASMENQSSSESSDNSWSG